MLKRLSAREKIEQLIADFEPLLRNAFMESVADIKLNIQIRRIVERLERNDIEGAIEALYLYPTAFRPLGRAVAQAFEGGGVAAVSDMPTLREPNGAKLLPASICATIVPRRSFGNAAAILSAALLKTSKLPPVPLWKQGLLRGGDLGQSLWTLQAASIA
ncbi:hypothetical protein [Phyllobacterium sp. K27]